MAAVAAAADAAPPTVVVKPPEPEKDQLERHESPVSESKTPRVLSFAVEGNDAPEVPDVPEGEPADQDGDEWMTGSAPLGDADPDSIHDSLGDEMHSPSASSTMMTHRSSTSDTRIKNQLDRSTRMLRARRTVTEQRNGGSPTTRSEFTQMRKKKRTALDMAEETLSSAGVMVDYLIRQLAGVDYDGDDDKMDRMESLLTHLSWDDHGTGVFQYASMEIAIEKQTTEITTEITKEAKATGVWAMMNVKSPLSPGGHSVSYETFRQRAKLLASGKNKERCLIAEVDFWIDRYQLLHCKVVSSGEDMWDRRARMFDFWSTFHDRRDGERLEADRLAQTFGDPDGAWPPSAPGQAKEARGRMTSALHGSSSGRLGDKTRGKGGAKPINSWSLPSLVAPTIKEEPNKPGTRGSDRSSSLGGSRCQSREWKTPGNLSRGGTSLAVPGAGALSIPSTSDWDRGLSRGSAPRRTGMYRPVSERSWGHEAPKDLSFQPNRRQRRHNEAASKQLFDISARSPASSFRARDGKLPALHSHQRRYLQECDDKLRVPIPLAFNTGHDKNFEAAGRDLVDQELMAISSMLDDTNLLEVADLTFNSLLTDNGLVPFLQQLSRKPLVQTLQQLLLGSCLRAGARTLESLVRVIGRASNLRKLDLSHVPLPMRMQVPLCRAIRKSSSLETVNLMDTGLSLPHVTKHCIEELLSSSRVQNLDLSWNCFTSECFACLGEKLVDNSALKNLVLANCSATVEGLKDSPVCLFLECLARDKSLKKLDITMNRISSEAFLILEDGLERHPKLQELVVCNNPLGVYGIRSALRLLSLECNEIQKINLDGCFSGTISGPRTEDEIQFSASSPGGRYQIDFDRACHRSLLRMLYKIADKFDVVPDDAFSGLRFTPGLGKNAPKAYSHPVKDSNGFRDMPRSGILSVFLNMQRCIEKAIDGLDTENCEEFLTQFFNKMRFHLNWKKAVPVLCNWKLLNGFMQQQNVFLEALAKDFCLKVPHLAAMCSANRLFAKDTLCRLMPLVPYDTPSRYLANHIVPTLGDFLWAHQRMHNLLNFNASNPTGHYKLHLDECCDYAIVERLHLLDRWESAIDVRRNFADTSKWGNRSHFRNELHRQKPIVGMGVSSMAEWTIPESGEVEFDYNSNRRPKKGTTPVSDKVWNHIMVTLYDSPLDEDSIMKALRRVSHIIALSSMNMRKMIGYFKKEQHRAECFTMFFFRITDIHNAKMFSSRFSSQQEVVNLQRRMGYVSFFPFVQPENAVFELDFAMHDQRLCASLLVALAVKEKAENLRDLLLVYPSGKEENFTSGMPAGWQTFDKVPKEGVFKCRYVCAPEDRKWEVRKKNAEVYGFYHIDALEKEVQWWTGLGEVPEDVLKFMEFCMWGVVEGRFKSLDDIFVKIDGPEGNGEISLKEMVAGLEKLNFKKFEGKDERDRINTVFRYLDPGGEGTVSKAEWKIFEQLWREFDLSVREWVHFMMLAFGDDLPTIWSILDTENDGELSMEDWLQAADDIGYFGPAHIVFSLLDYSDDGSISFDEFEVLEKYKQEES